MKLNIKVIPGAKKVSIEPTEVDIFGNEVMKIKLTAKPTDGEANEQLIKLLSDHFNKSKYKISIVSGHTSRNKIVEIKD